MHAEATFVVGKLGSTPRRAGAAVDPAALSALSRDVLQSEWKRLFHHAPPGRMGRDLLELGVAWELQAAAFGGLDRMHKRRLAELVAALETTGEVPKTETSAAPRSGARLIREWHGDTHEVLVAEDGFLWRGKRWRSLSAIAQAITGVRWSGPRFFGLTKAPTGAGVAAGPDASEGDSDG